MRLNFDSEIKANTAIKLLTENGISADSIEQNLPSLEDVFLTLIDEKAERIYINEVGHMEMHVTANAGPVLHQIFDAPLGKAFGFICAGPAGIAIVAADTAVKSSPVDIVWYGTPSINLSRTNEVIIGVSGDYGAVKKAVDTAYEKASALIEVFGQKPASILHFKPIESTDKAE